MEELKEKFCRLCLNTINDCNFKVIEGYTKEIFKFVLSNLDFDEGSKQELCNDCFTKLFESYNFKATCLETEDSISAFVESENVPLHNMKEVFMIVKHSECINDTAVDYNVCRLCMNLATNEFICLKEADKDMINESIPEVNLSTIKNPVICSTCSQSFERYRSFLKICEDADGKINKIGGFSLKTEEICIKSEGDVSESTTIVQNPTLYREDMEIVKRGKQSYPKWPKFKCNKCPFEHRFRSGLQYHQLRHKNPSEVKMHKCTKCSFQTKFKYSLKNHQLVHKDRSEITLYACEECDFKAKKKWHLRRHMIVHSSEVPMYECNQCQYKTKHKHLVKLHKDVHKDLSDRQRHKCDKCEYKTTRGHNLRNHMLIHSDPSKVKMFSCEYCEYKSIHKNGFLQHQLKHKDASDVKMYKCSECEYETRYQCVFKKHQVVHKDASQVQMYKCNECGFETKHKNSLVCHQLRHKETKKVAMYKCDECDYESKVEWALTNHKLRHSTMDGLMYKCDKCEYKNKRRYRLVKHKLTHLDSEEVKNLSADESENTKLP